MRRLSRSLAPMAALVAAALLPGCASGPQVDPQVTAALSARNVGSTTYVKVENGRTLDYADILDLVSKKVPSHIIVSYLQSTQKVYTFTPAQLRGLRTAGATPQLLNYLQETEGFYAYHPPAARERTRNDQKDAYYNTPAYQDEAPFAYNEPIIDDWYDSAYEESLYSPFSMD